MSEQSTYRVSLSWDEIYVILLALETVTFAEKDNQKDADRAFRKLQRRAYPPVKESMTVQKL